MPLEFSSRTTSIYQTFRESGDRVDRASDEGGRPGDRVDMWVDERGRFLTPVVAMALRRPFRLPPRRCIRGTRAIADASSLEARPEAFRINVLKHSINLSLVPMQQTYASRNTQHAKSYP